MNQGIFALKRLIILDLGLNIDIINNRSRLKQYRYTIPGEYIWARDNKALVRGYRDIYIEIIISKENK